MDAVEYQEMTKDEMQRFLDQQAKEGKSEVEAFRALAEIIGIRYMEGKK